MKRRVVVTGAGLVTPLGVGVDGPWKAACAGKSGIGEITRFNASHFETQIAGEVKDFHPADFLPKKDSKRLETFIAYAIAASRIALEDAELVIDRGNSQRVGVLTGCGVGGLGMLERTNSVLLSKGPKRVGPFNIPNIIGNMAPGMISIHCGAKGPNSSVATDCAAGAHAIGDAARMIMQNEADVMIAGGVESAITPTCIAGLNALKVLSTQNAFPAKASRPFDRDRDGLVVGEGAGILILEALEQALARGARIYAELVGYGTSCDGNHMVAPDSDGQGAARCMQSALADAGISPRAIDYINAHGTSTRLNDLSETRGVKRVFGERAYELAISSTKSMTGHLLGAAGGVEAIFTAFSVYESRLPPTINLDHPAAGCDLDYVPHVSRAADIRFAMTNSFGFGGTNASLILKRWPP